MRNCAGMSRDMSHIVFYCRDLGPGNVIVHIEIRGIVRARFNFSSGSYGLPGCGGRGCRVELETSLEDLVRWNLKKQLTHS
ncbi:hypothetical protein VTI28DRAFT_293 [Corynascus sepedonium]